MMKDNELSNVAYELFLRDIDFDAIERKQGKLSTEEKMAVLTKAWEKCD